MALEAFLKLLGGWEGFELVDAEDHPVGPPRSQCRRSCCGCARFRITPSDAVGGNRMRKHILLRVDIQVQEHPDERIVSVALGDEAMFPWTVGLTLLKEQLVEALVVTFATATLQLDLTYDQRLTKHRAIDRWGYPTLSVRLSDSELRYWQHFCLRYLRDGRGDVDHIDSEVAPVPPRIGARASS